MSKILGDNTVIPSYLGTSTRGHATGGGSSLNDSVLRIGEVKKLIYPGDKGSYSKRNLEYEVEVQYRDRSGIYATSIYRGVTASNVFGGTADRFHATMRPDTSKNRDKDIGTGSNVLILCLSGDQQKGIILGGLADPRSSKRQEKSEGHNLYFEFNGTRFTIDKDGQPTFTFRGATDVKGDLLDSAVAEAEGTKIGVDKEGSLTAATPEEKQFIRLNHKDKKIEVLADEEWNVTVNGKMVVETGKDISIETTEGKIDVTASKKVFIKSEGVHVGDATDAWVKGTTYRKKEENMHSTMKGLLSSISTALNTAATSFDTASTLMKASPAGSMAASVPLQIGAMALKQTPELFNQLASAISTFEGSSSDYLSKKNKTD